LECISLFNALGEAFRYLFDFFVASQEENDIPRCLTGMDSEDRMKGCFQGVFYRFRRVIDCYWKGSM